MALLTLILIIFLFVFIIGLCIGSFLNVVISRAFSNESIAHPRSKCPSCQTQLKWYHNIPLISYMILKGKCAFCDEKISVQYPLVELITGLLFVGVFLKFGLGINAIFILIFVSLFVVLSATDIKEKVVFDFHTYALVVAGLIYNLFNIGGLQLGDKILTLGKLSIVINNSFIYSIIGIIAGILIMEAFARFGYLVAGTRAFGEGDTYIAAGLGAVFGIQYLLTVLLYGFIVQIFLTIPVFIKKLFVNQDYKTLGSFLIFFFLIIAMKALDYYNMTTNLILFSVIALALISTGIYLCKRIIGGLKEQGEENFTYLPFGPALVIGGLIVLFVMFPSPY